ncbi:hypothetical protein KVT40_003481 [Elsinoe batatas]|uniref:M protein, serotype 2.1 n=1 Tax=Elsinoe batatas TaxID=2601811 RepID=A0A8K0L8C4_9PEZI|nr:hypothetical protein KVT40_003481 [Elsinoe batatas]
MSTPANSQSSTAAAGRRPQRDVPTAESTPQKVIGKQTTPSSNSTARSRSTRTPGAGTPISARSAVKKPVNGSSNATNVRNGHDGDSTTDDDSKSSAAAAIEDLQDRLRQAEEAAENYQRQITLLETHLQASTEDQGKLEETIQESNERIEDLENHKRDSLRSRRELEAIYESDRAASIKFREESQAREDQLLETIQRLKDTLAQRPPPEEDRKPGISRTSSFLSGASPQIEGGHFAPSSSLHRSDSRSSSRLVLQKDKVIEGLRIELAEAQIRIVEMENRGGPQTQELENKLMETRMANARLMEENESFQLLLSEKTLNGDLTHSTLLAGHNPHDGIQGSTLADELDNADGENDDETVREYKTRIASLTDENKALTLYINSIISRLLANDFDFILDKDADPASQPKAARPAEKELPLPPSTETGGQEGFLSRTLSVMGGRKPRPQSIAIPDSALPPTPHENPETAPSIPIGRGQAQRTGSGSQPRRNTADWSSAALVNNMYRGPSPTRSGQLSPGITSPRNSFLGSRPSGSSRVASGSTVPTISESEKSEYVHRQQRDSKISSGRNSIASDTDQSGSPPPSTIGGNSDKGTGSIMVGSKMRPLRLVNQSADEEAAKKAANRASWMGWFNKGT